MRYNCRLNLGSASAPCERRWSDWRQSGSWFAVRAAARLSAIKPAAKWRSGSRIFLAQTVCVSKGRLFLKAWFEHFRRHLKLRNFSARKLRRSSELNGFTRITALRIWSRCIFCLLIISRHFPRILGNIEFYVLAKMNNIHLGKAYEKVSAIMPSEVDAADLQIDRQQPVLRLERIVHTTEGAIIEMRIARCFLREKHYSAVIP